MDYGRNTRMDGDERRRRIVQLRDRYVDAVFERTFTAYPSGDMLDRAEGICSTPEQTRRLIEYLILQVEASRYPSHHLMDRLDRIFFGVSKRRGK
jgi:hypothetical protein